MLCMLDTIAANRGGCALGRVCKPESQTLARRSDLRAMQARPGFHEIMPGCLCVCVCVRVCVRACVVRVCVCVCPTRHQVGVRWQHCSIAAPGDALKVCALLALRLAAGRVSSLPATAPRAAAVTPGQRTIDYTCHASSGGCHASGGGWRTCRPPLVAPQAASGKHAVAVLPRSQLPQLRTAATRTLSAFTPRHRPLRICTSSAGAGVQRLACISLKRHSTLFSWGQAAGRREGPLPIIEPSPQEALPRHR